MGIGRRVAEARAEQGVTQEQLAVAVGLERSVLAKIETEKRRLSALELVAIARELQRRVEWFVDDAPPALVSYRRAHPDVATQAIDLRLDELVRETEFVVSCIPGLVSGQPEPLPPPATAAEAEEMAATARHMLGLGPAGPAHNIAGLAAALGLLVFSLDLGDGADAGTVLLEKGGVTLVNGSRMVGRRRLAAAHELGHFLIADEYALDWRVASSEADGLEARLDRFARALLLPESDLRTRWARWTNTPDESWRDAAVRAASCYRVDMATLARRLKELRLVEHSRAEDIRQVQTRRADIVEKDLVVSDELAPVALPRTYEQAVLALYRREAVTEGRALGLLLGTFDSASLPELPPVPASEIWTVTS